MTASGTHCEFGAFRSKSSTKEPLQYRISTAESIIGISHAILGGVFPKRGTKAEYSKWYSTFGALGRRVKNSDLGFLSWKSCHSDNMIKIYLEYAGFVPEVSKSPPRIEELLAFKGGFTIDGV